MKRKIRKNITKNLAKVLGRKVTLTGKVISIPDEPTFLLHVFNLEVERESDSFTILVIVKQVGFKVQELLGKKVEVKGILKLMLEDDDSPIVEAQEITHIHE